jgi:hypothetical protein
VTPEQEPLPFPDLVHPAHPRGATLDDRFRSFHAANGWVLTELERMTAELVDRGRTRIGIGMLFEVLRWEHDRRAGTRAFRLNNSYRSRYARLIVTRHPEWTDLFELRALSSA